jgi:hypothetical protein
MSPHGFRSKGAAYTSMLQFSDIDTKLASTQLLHFQPEALLPKDYKLVLDTELSVLTLIYTPAACEARIEFQRQVQPKAMIALQLLLEASPHCCTYADLLVGLRNQPYVTCVKLLLDAGQDRDTWKALLTPVWRAITKLQASVFELGFQIVSQEGKGYRLINPARGPVNYSVGR